MASCGLRGDVLAQCEMGAGGTQELIRKSYMRRKASRVGRSGRGCDVSWVFGGSGGSEDTKFQLTAWKRLAPPPIIGSLGAQHTCVGGE